MQNNRRHHIKKNLRKNFLHGKVCHLTDTGMWSKLKHRNKVKERRTVKNLKKRMAAIAMALLVSTSMLPLDAFAAEYTGSTESATEVTTDVPVSGDTEQPATEVPVDTEQQTEAPADTEQAVDQDAAAYEAVEAEAEENAAMEEQMDARMKHSRKRMIQKKPIPYWREVSIILLSMLRRFRLRAHRM